jgi:DNA-binding NarL/FixJ family response regulator
MKRGQPSSELTTVRKSKRTYTAAVSPIGVSIVEDDAQARQILADWISRAKGFRCVSHYGSAEEAVEHLVEDRPDVVLMDINLLAMNGVECVRQLKPKLPKTQFIMLTVYEDSDHIFDALSAGASGYLLKQTPADELLVALSEVHAGASPMTGSIARRVVQYFHKAPSKPVPGVSLSPREREVLELLARGYLYKEIAEALKMSVPTVNTHIRHIYEKMHVQSRGQAVAIYANLTGEPARPDKFQRR